MQFNTRTVMKLIDAAVRVVRSATSPPAGPSSPAGGRRRPAGTGHAGSTAGLPERAGSGYAGGSGWQTGGYPGDFAGTLLPSYRPQPDGEPDPGEVVWAWVPYEEDHTRGKDRPVLLVGRDGRYLLGLMLTSRDRNNAHADDPDYVDVGSGAWDSHGRPSEVKLDRIVRLEPGGIRREGAVLDKPKFDAVVRRMASNAA